MLEKSGRVGFVSTDLRWLNSSKPHLPWYAPIPDAPTPPNGSLAVDTWKARWLTSMPPAGTSLITRSRTARVSVNRYADSGLGRELTKRIASSWHWTEITGKMGPKISLLISGSSGAGSTTTVGSRRSVEASELPPNATLPLVFATYSVSRSNWRWLTIRNPC